jgi:hypothetical protein
MRQEIAVNANDERIAKWRSSFRMAALRIVASALFCKRMTPGQASAKPSTTIVSP